MSPVKRNTKFLIRREGSHRRNINPFTQNRLGSPPEDSSSSPPVVSIQSSENQSIQNSEQSPEPLLSPKDLRIKKLKEKLAEHKIHELFLQQKFTMNTRADIPTMAYLRPPSPTLLPEDPVPVSSVSNASVIQEIPMEVLKTSKHKQVVKFAEYIGEHDNNVVFQDAVIQPTSKMNSQKIIEGKRDEYFDSALISLLTGLGLQKFYPVMKKHKINYSQFLKLNEADLIELGICKLDDIKMVMNYITESLKSPAADQKSQDALTECIQSSLTTLQVKKESKDLESHMNLFTNAVKQTKKKLHKNQKDKGLKEKSKVERKKKNTSKKAAKKIKMISVAGITASIVIVMLAVFALRRN